MKKCVFVLGIMALLTACNKDNFETKPTLKIESLSSEVVQKDNDLQINFSFTDKEGDVSDTLFFMRDRLNSRGRYTPLTLNFRIPTIAGEQDGEIVLRIPYRDLTTDLSAIRIPGSSPSRNEPDTMLYRFVLQDKAGNRSDTVRTSVVVLR